MVPSLSLEEQVGQVIMGVWSGDAEHLAGLAAAGRIGGILVQPGAAQSARDLAATLNRAQRLATHPLLCAGDPEAGSLPGTTLLPGTLALGAARQPDLARRCGELTAREARAMGIHLVLGPTLDVHREPNHLPSPPRSFGENPSLVACLGAAFVEGCRAGGALAVGSHFPGRGSAVYDHRRNLVVVPESRLTLEKIDLVPFVHACQAGLRCIMTGHMHIAALDSLPTRLATHSSAVVGGLLRSTLGFDGLLLTDNLDAQEIRVRYSPGEAAVLAFAAGHDLLITESPEEVYRALYEVLLHGDIPRSRLEQAVRRIWAVKEELGLLRERFASGEIPTGEEGPTLAREVAQAALIAVKGQPERLVRPGLLLLSAHPPCPEGSSVTSDLQRLAATYLPSASFQVLDGQPASQTDQVLAAAMAAEAAILFLDPAGANEALAGLARTLKRLGLAVGVVLMGNPYPLARFPEADLLLYIASSTPACLEAVFSYLLGQTRASARLPFTVRGLPPASP